MNFGEYSAILDELGMTNWMSREIEASTRIIINGIAEYFLGDTDPYEFTPFIEHDSIQNYFIENAWEIDWYSILSREFIDSVDLNIDSIVSSLRNADPTLTIENTKNLVEQWAHEWRVNVKSALQNEMKKTM